MGLLDTSKIQLDIARNRTHLPVESAGTLFVLATVRASKEAEEQTKLNPRQVHLLLCIDVSQSMSFENKLETAKKVALARIRRDLQQNDLVSLIAFSASAQEHIALAVVGEAREKLESEIERLAIGTNTNIYEAIALSADLISKSPPDHVRRILLLTDGRATAGIADPASIVDLAKKAAEAHKSVVDVIGIGPDYDRSLTNGIAEATGGTSRHAQKPEDMDRLSETLLDKYKHTVIDNPSSLQIQLPSREHGNTSLDQAMQLSPELKAIQLDREGSTWSCRLGPISVARPYIIALIIRTQGYKEIQDTRVGVTQTIANLETAGVRQDIAVEFTRDIALLQKETDKRPRIAYTIASLVSEIVNSTLSGDALKAQDRTSFLDRVLSSPEVADVVNRDLTLSVIVAKYRQAKTIVDDRTKVDKLTKIRE